MILVTGATGFLGSFICRKLLEENRPFIALKRASSSLSLLEDIKEHINWHEGDVLDTDSIESIIEKVDTIIHSAAMVSFHAPDMGKMEQVNVAGTKNLVNLSAKHNIEKFIHISSVAAVGKSQKHGTLDESNKWQNSKWNTHYAESKYLAELEVWRGIVEGLNGVIVNPSVILGPGDWNKSSSAIFKYVWEESKFYTDGLVNYVDVRDVTSIVSKLIDDTEKYGNRYILNAGAVSFGELFEEIARRFGKKPPSIKASNPVLLKIGLFIEWVKYITTGIKPMVTRETIRNSDNRIYFDNAKVVKELNYTFAPLGETLDWVCAEYLNDKK